MGLLPTSGVPLCINPIRLRIGRTILYRTLISERDIYGLWSIEDYYGTGYKIQNGQATPKRQDGGYGDNARGSAMDGASGKGACPPN
jgi:hypothetical protein